MKAASYIIQTVQRPFTIFGLPPRLFALVGGAGTLTFGVLTGLGVMSLALPLMVVVFVGCYGVAYRATQRDCHVASRLFLGIPWWRGAARRTLIAGGPH